MISHYTIVVFFRIYYTIYVHAGLYIQKSKNRETYFSYYSIDYRARYSTNGHFFYIFKFYLFVTRFFSVEFDYGKLLFFYYLLLF